MNGLTIPVDALRLRKARESRGLKQKWVAEQIGISKQSLSTYERGQALPSIQTVERLCELYGCAITEIVSRKDAASVLGTVKRVGDLLRSTA